MKQFSSFIVLIVIAAVSLFGQKTKEGVTSTTGQFLISFNAQQQNDAIVLPFIEGKQLNGTKERYGILFRSAQGKNSFVEILDENGKALQSISLNDFIGKTVSGDVKLLSNSIIGNGRASETIHEIKLSNGPVKLITRSLLSGDKNNVDNPEQIIVTMSISGSKTQNFALRLHFPIEGNAEVKNKGVILTGKTSPSAIALSVLPSNDSISIKKNVLTIKSPVMNISGETPVVWLIVRNTSGTTKNASTTVAGDVISNSIKKYSEPSIVIVNMISKENAQPSDTVIYTLVCKNIGSGDASNIILSNPIPAGTTYIEGSASTDAAELTIERVSAAPSSAATQLRWTLKDPLAGGKERWVNFKVIIQ